MKSNRSRSSDESGSRSPEPSSGKLCKANCQFFGLDKFQGYCSMCFKQKVLADVKTVKSSSQSTVNPGTSPMVESKPNQRKRKLSESSSEQHGSSKRTSAAAAPLASSIEDEISKLDSDISDSDMDIDEEEEILDSNELSKLDQTPGSKTEAPKAMVKMPGKPRCGVCSRSVAHIGKFMQVSG